LDSGQVAPLPKYPHVTIRLWKDAFFLKINIMAKQKTPEQVKRIELSHKLIKLRLERNLNPEDIECNNLALEYGSRILSSYMIPFSFEFDHNKL